MAYTKEDLRPIPQSDKTGIPLLREMVERIKADERAWRQSDWISSVAELDAAVREYIVEHEVVPWNCGTAYCVAGHVALAKGAKLTPHVIDQLAGRGDYVNEDSYYRNRFSTGTIIRPDGRREAVDEYAMEVVGLSYDQATTLFAGPNTLEMIEAFVQVLEDDPTDDLTEISEHLESTCNGDPDNPNTDHHPRYDPCKYCVAGKYNDIQVPE
jgi:hypothetical protein